MENVLTLALLVALVLGAADVILTRGRSLAGWGVTLIAAGFLWDKVA